jgi:hypothetical protein
MAGPEGADMRRLRYLAAFAAITSVLTGSAVTAASAATSQGAGAQAAAGVRLHGGTTAVTTAPGVASALLQHGIVPRATWPASQSVLSLKSGPAVRFAFPVTGGLVSLSPLGGNVYHGGGILFRNVNNGKMIEVSLFTIDLTHGDLTGIVNGSPKARVPLFRLDLSHAKLAAGKHLVTARGIGLKLTAVAARALNAALGTRLFSAGLELGTAKTVLRF